MSIKYQNLHSLKEGMIHLCQSILETRRISYVHGSAPFTIPLRTKNRQLVHSPYEMVWWIPKLTLVASKKNYQNFLLFRFKYIIGGSLFLMIHTSNYFTIPMS